jgi:hypothetical protein
MCGDWWYGCRKRENETGALRERAGVRRRMLRILALCSSFLRAKGLAEIMAD